MPASTRSAQPPFRWREQGEAISTRLDQMELKFVAGVEFEALKRVVE